MTTNQTINGVPRELLENLIAKAYGEKPGNPDFELDELRALLAAPVSLVERELGSPPIDHMAWLLDKVVCPGDYPQSVLHEQIRSTLSVIGKPAAQRQGEPVAVYQVEYLGDGGGGWADVGYREFKAYLSKPDFRTRTLYTEQPAPVDNGTTSDKYRAELYDEVWQLARSMGFNNVTDALKCRPAPVAVVLPDHRDSDLRSPCYEAAKGWNACLDEVTRLNTK